MQPQRPEQQLRRRRRRRHRRRATPLLRSGPCTAACPAEVRSNARSIYRAPLTGNHPAAAPMMSPRLDSATLPIVRTHAVGNDCWYRALVVHRRELTVGCGMDDAVTRSAAALRAAIGAHPSMKSSGSEQLRSLEHWNIGAVCVLPGSTEVVVIQPANVTQFAVMSIVSSDHFVPVAHRGLTEDAS